MNFSGKLLIAPPSVKKSFWSKSVIFLTEDHDRGSIGFVLNKPTRMTIIEFSTQHGIESDVPGFIHVGGPVNVNALTVLHSSEWSCGNTMQVNEYFSISSSADLLMKFAQGDLPKKWRMFAGLCAWAPDQLNCEIKGIPPYRHDTSWLFSSANTDLVFNSDAWEQWTTSVEKCSFEFAQTLLD
jgi:putative transcriptional regulator